MRLLVKFPWEFLLVAPQIYSLEKSLPEEQSRENGPRYKSGVLTVQVLPVFLKHQQIYVESLEQEETLAS